MNLNLHVKWVELKETLQKLKEIDRIQMRVSRHGMCVGGDTEYVRADIECAWTETDNVCK